MERGIGLLATETVKIFCPFTPQAAAGLSCAVTQEPRYDQRLISGWSQVRNSSVPLKLIWRDKKIDVRSDDFGAVEKRLNDMTDAELAALEQRMIAATPIVLEATAEVSDDAGELADGDVEDSPALIQPWLRICFPDRPLGV